MHILLIRHGETASNRGRVLQTPDIPLNEQGIHQARRLAERLRAHGIRRILASDHTRAAMTAEAISQRCGIPIEFESGLRERSFGDLRGRPYSEIEGDLFALDFEPPNGETWEHFHDRVAGTWRRIVESEHPDALASGPLVLVTHGLVCRSLAERQLELPEHIPLPRFFRNTSLTVIRAVAPYTVERIDCCEHLEDDSTPGHAGGAV